MSLLSLEILFACLWSPVCASGGKLRHALLKAFQTAWDFTSTHAYRNRFLANLLNSVQLEVLHHRYVHKHDDDDGADDTASAADDALFFAPCPHTLQLETVRVANPLAALSSNDADRGVNTGRTTATPGADSGGAQLLESLCPYALRSTSFDLIRFILSSMTSQSSLRAKKAKSAMRDVAVTNGAVPEHSSTCVGVDREVYITNLIDIHSLDLLLLSELRLYFAAAAQARQGQGQSRGSGRHPFHFASWLEGFKKRLHLLSYIFRYSEETMETVVLSGLFTTVGITPPDRPLQKDGTDTNGFLTASEREDVHKSFFAWLRCASCWSNHTKQKWTSRSSPCMNRHALVYLLNELGRLICNRQLHVSMQVFFLFQCLFLEVNAVHLVTMPSRPQSFNVGPAMPLGHQKYGMSRPPPQSLSGEKMIGRWIKVQQDQEGKEFRDGVLLHYSSSTGLYTIQYIDGSVHKRNLHTLKQWVLLSPLEEQRPMPVNLSRVVSTELVCLKGLWSIAMEARDADVVGKAQMLLLALYENMDRVPDPGVSTSTSSTSTSTSTSTGTMEPVLAVQDELSTIAAVRQTEVANVGGGEQELHGEARALGTDVTPDPGSGSADSSGDGNRRTTTTTTVSDDRGDLDLGVYAPDCGVNNFIDIQLVRQQKVRGKMVSVHEWVSGEVINHLRDNTICVEYSSTGSSDTAVAVLNSSTSIANDATDDDSDNDEQWAHIKVGESTGVCTWPPEHRGRRVPRIANYFAFSDKETALHRRQICVLSNTRDCRASLLEIVFAILSEKLGAHKHGAGRDGSSDNERGGLAGDVDDGSDAPQKVGELLPSLDTYIHRSMEMLEQFSLRSRTCSTMRTHQANGQGRMMKIRLVWEDHLEVLATKKGVPQNAKVSVHSKSSMIALHNAICDVIGHSHFNCTRAAMSGSSGSRKCLQTSLQDMSVQELNLGTRRRQRGNWLPICMQSIEEIFTGLGYASDPTVLYIQRRSKYLKQREVEQLQLLECLHPPPSDVAPFIEFCAGDVIATNDTYFSILMEILELPVAPATFQGVWRLLQQTPSNRSLYESIRVNSLEGELQVYTSASQGSAGFRWRDVYILQLVEALLLPADAAEEAMAATPAKWDTTRFLKQQQGLATFLFFFTHLPRLIPSMRFHEVALAVPSVMRVLMFLVIGANPHPAAASVRPEMGEPSASAASMLPETEFRPESAAYINQQLEMLPGGGPLETDYETVALCLVKVLEHAHASHTRHFVRPVFSAPEVGDTVLCEYKNGSKYRATIVACKPGGAYDVVYVDDLIKDTDVDASKISPIGRSIYQDAERVAAERSGVLGDAVVHGLRTLDVILHTKGHLLPQDCIGAHVVPLLIPGLLLHSPDGKVRAMACTVLLKLCAPVPAPLGRGDGGGDNTVKKMEGGTVEAGIATTTGGHHLCRELVVTKLVEESQKISLACQTCDQYFALLTAVIRNDSGHNANIDAESATGDADDFPSDAGIARSFNSNSRPALSPLLEAAGAVPKTVGDQRRAQMNLMQLLIDRLRLLTMQCDANLDRRNNDGATHAAPEGILPVNVQEEKMLVGTMEHLRQIVEVDDELRKAACRHRVHSIDNVSGSRGLNAAAGAGAGSTQATAAAAVPMLTYSLTEFLLRHFLLPVSRNGTKEPVCTSFFSREAACSLLTTIVRDIPEELEKASAHFIHFIADTPVPLRRSYESSTRKHRQIPSWDYEPKSKGSSTSVCKRRNATGKVGLVNMGSTCYMNATLQQLFAVDAFVKAVLSMPTPPNDARLNLSLHNAGDNGGAGGGGSADAGAAAVTNRGSVLRELQRLFWYMRDCFSGCADPSEALVPACSVLNLEYSVTAQNDAAEFLDKLLDVLDTQMKHKQGPHRSAKPGEPRRREEEGWSVSDTFGGSISRFKKCHNCGKTQLSGTTDFIRLELFLKENDHERHSVEECLKAMIQPEVMSGDNRVFCEHCNEKCDTTFHSSISKLSEYLILNPARFAFDLTVMDRVKLNHYVEFPQTFDLAPYIIDSQDPALHVGDIMPSVVVDVGEDGSGGDVATGSAGAGSVGADAASFQNAHRQQPGTTATKQSTQYALQGVIVHAGDTRFGHYYSFAKCACSGKWNKYNDDDVSPFDPDRY
jgi:ubiquitin C-terminal hydrolase